MPVISDVRHVPLRYNPNTLSLEVWDGTVTGSVGGGGGDASAANQALEIAALGATADAEAAGNGSIIAILKRIRTLLGGTLAVSGTFWQATQPVSAAALPLPSNAAQETGGNLATIAGKDFATSAKQDTGNTSLSTIAGKDFATSAKQDTGNTSLATIAGKDFATAANQATGIASLATIATNVAPLVTAQGAASSGVAGPLTQAVVSDTPESYAADTVRPLSMTADGRLRVSVTTSPNELIWQSTFSSPWACAYASAAGAGVNYV